LWNEGTLRQPRAEINSWARSTFERVFPSKKQPVPVAA